MSKKDLEDNEPIEIKGVKVTHQGRILFPKSKISKLDVINYYIKVQKKILPDLADRVISMVRSPDGINAGRFYQKHPSENFPEYIERVKIKEKEGSDYYITIDQIEDLIYLVNQGVLEFHIGNSTASDFEHPNRIVFDLDPGEGSKYEYIVDGSYELREILDSYKIKSSVKTSGIKGFHIIGQLNEKMSWDDSKALSLEIANKLVVKFPEKYTTSLPKEDRVGKVFVDYLRNSRGGTTVAAYSTRTREGAPISMPIKWEDVRKVKPDEFNINNFE